VYFACFTVNEAKEVENGIELKEDAFSRDTAQDIYVSLKTDDGMDIVKGINQKFSLKKQLRNKVRTFTIGTIKPLGSLKGVDKLNRL
jgi:hypothetical protein